MLKTITVHDLTNNARYVFALTDDDDDSVVVQRGDIVPLLVAVGRLEDELTLNGVEYEAEVE